MAVELVEEMRWGDAPACPRCGDTDVYKMQDRQTGARNTRFLWRCRGCKKQYTVRIGTIFEDSRIPMRLWCHAFWRACSSKKGVSALQIKRETGLSYKSALFMMHRIRFAMATDPNPPKLRDVVEADETFVGGKPRYKLNKSKGDWYSAKRPKWSDKTPVFAVVQRGGEVRTRVLDRVTRKNVTKALKDFVDPYSLVYTDESSCYKWMGRPWSGGHASVNHSAREYVRGDVYTNTIEGFFSLFKRGIYGTFHSVGKKHLHRYASEFEFRHNTRGLTDGERTLAAIRQAEGRRLSYLSQLHPRRNR